MCLAGEKKSSFPDKTYNIGYGPLSNFPTLKEQAEFGGTSPCHDFLPSPLNRMPILTGLEEGNH